MWRWLLVLSLICMAPAALADETSASDAKRPKKAQPSGPKRQHRPKRRVPPAEPAKRDTEADTRELKTVFFSGRDRLYGFELSGASAISKVLDANTRLLSAEIGLLVDHENVYGLSYTQLASPLAYSEGGVDLTAKLSYWGLDLVGIIDWDDIFNQRAALFVGSGTLDVGPEDGGERVRRPVYVLEPRWGFYFNVLPFLRFGLDVSYRFVAVDARGERGEPYSGLSYTVALRGGPL